MNKLITSLLNRSHRVVERNGESFDWKRLDSIPMKKKKLGKSVEATIFERSVILKNVNVDARPQIGVVVASIMSCGPVKSLLLD